MGFGFRIKQLDYDLTPVAGLALVGHHLKRLDPLFKRLDAQWPCRGGQSKNTQACAPRPAREISSATGTPS
ncbi:hypothetical protein THIX_60558 [Thiomonas sp. X19]|nr:hypothetical protein THIX_60558 [Thiomonas sp. X19]